MLWSATKRYWKKFKTCDAGEKIWKNRHSKSRNLGKNCSSHHFERWIRKHFGTQVEVRTSNGKWRIKLNIKQRSFGNETSWNSFHEFPKKNNSFLSCLRDNRSSLYIFEQIVTIESSSYLVEPSPDSRHTTPFSTDQCWFQLRFAAPISRLFF